MDLAATMGANMGYANTFAALVAGFVISGCTVTNPDGSTTTYTVGASYKPGIPPVGPLSAPGCEGIEILSYASDNDAFSKTFAGRFEIVMRNNNSVARIVYFTVKRHPESYDRNRPEQMSQQIPAASIVNVRADFSPQPPLSVTITKCV
jgi:hypothetical protein